MGFVKTIIIGAMSINEVIGKNNDLPWKDRKDLKWDMEHFKRTTSNHIVVMGYNTFQSLGSKPLPNRINYVITHGPKASAFDNLIFIDSIEEAINHIQRYNQGENEVYIIGGEKLYTEALEKDIVDEIIITVIKDQCDGDKYFPVKLAKDFHIYNKIEKAEGFILYLKRNND